VAFASGQLHRGQQGGQRLLWKLHANSIIRCWNNLNVVRLASVCLRDKLIYTTDLINIS